MSILSCMLAIFAAGRPSDTATFRPPYLQEHELPVHSSERLCGAYSAWSALHIAGIETTLDDLMNEMKISVEGTTVLDITKVLQKRGLSTSVVMIPRAKLSEQKSPFILWSRPPNSGASKKLDSDDLPQPVSGRVGHFVVVVPLDGDEWLWLDGPKRAARIKSTNWEAPESVNGWDGTAILFSHPAASVPWIDLSAILLGAIAGPVVIAARVKRRNGDLENSRGEPTKA